MKPRYLIPGTFLSWLCLSAGSQALGDSSLADHFAQMDPPFTESDWTIHDPSRVVTVGGQQMVASTARAHEDGYGCGLEIWTRDGPEAPWQPGFCLFTQTPAWIEQAFQDVEGAFLAPAFLDEHTLYYAVSDGFDQDGATCLGLARAAGSGSAMAWEDLGRPVTCTRSRADEPVGMGGPEAVDPATLITPEGERYLVFGGGVVVLARVGQEGLLVPVGGQPADDPAYVVLARPPQMPEDGETWIEAPFLHHRDGFYYLFVNHFICCRDGETTYQIHMGRSERPEGPYLTRDGKRLDQGHGTPLLFKGGAHIGPGQAGIWTDGDGQDWLTFHYYDESRDGLPWIGERRLIWDGGWPRVAHYPSAD